MLVTTADSALSIADSHVAGDAYPQHIDTAVLVVGGGPVGMTLALQLGARGVPVVLVEQSLDTTTNPRCNTTNARSMEYFRGLGLAGRIRRVGLPLDHPTDMVYTTSLTGYELTRFEFSTAQQAMDGTAPEYAEWPTPELQHRISQIYLEPILDRELRRYSSVRVMRGWQIKSLTHDSGGAQVRALDTASGAALTIRGQYVVGCDGAASTVRRGLDIALAGDSQVGERRLSIYFRSNAVKLPPGRPGWRYLWRGERYHGAVIQLDGSSLYLCHARVPDHEELADADADLAMREAMGFDVPHEKIDVVRWVPRRLVADRFREGRVLLAGDAAHVWLPDGGFGMNTGIADAVSLAWRIAAIYSGWGTETLLDDYAFERRSVGEATSDAAKTIGKEMVDLSVRIADPRLRAESAESDALRLEVGELIRNVDRKQWYSAGVQLGSRYIGSPGVAPGSDGDAARAIGSITEYIPTVEPGSRLPHLWTDERAECVFDLLGQGYTVLRIGAHGREGLAEIERAAVISRVPVTIIDLPAEAARVYNRPWILVRPDWCIAWSGTEQPADWVALLRSLTGFDRVPAEVTGARASNTAVTAFADPFEGTSWAART